MGRPVRISGVVGRASLTTALLKRLKLRRATFAFDHGMLKDSCGCPFTFCDFGGKFSFESDAKIAIFSGGSNDVLFSRPRTSRSHLSGNGTVLRAICSSLKGE